jgi:hypothetical protein
MTLHAPFPYFGGKRRVTGQVWARLGEPKHYIEPFCGSAAMLLAAPAAASLEVICDINGFIANFWRAVKHQADKVAEYADYPVSHIDLGARHDALVARRAFLAENLHDPDWPGDAKAAGWWLWGQCSWIGSGWCEWNNQAVGQIPHLNSAGRGVQAVGRIPHISDAGQGVQAVGKIPHISDAGRGVQAVGQIPHISDPILLTSAGRTAWEWLRKLANRLERVRIVHGDWSRCLNVHYGAEQTAVFLDPPYQTHEDVYSQKTNVAEAVEAWARDNAHLRIALCGLVGDYDLPEWAIVRWSRPRFTYSGTQTTDKECLWFSPACLPAEPAQRSLFDLLAGPAAAETTLRLLEKGEAER